MTKRLRPVKEKQAPSPQCEAPFDSAPYTEAYRGYRERRIMNLHPDWDALCCGRSAAYEIDGKFLCSSHAGQAAIKILLGETQ